MSWPSSSASSSVVYRALVLPSALLDWNELEMMRTQSSHARRRHIRLVLLVAILIQSHGQGIRQDENECISRTWYIDVVDPTCQSPSRAAAKRVCSMHCGLCAYSRSMLFDSEWHVAKLQCLRMLYVYEAAVMGEKITCNVDNLIMRPPERETVIWKHM